MTSTTDGSEVVVQDARIWLRVSAERREALLVEFGRIGMTARVEACVAAAIAVQGDGNGDEVISGLQKLESGGPIRDYVFDNIRNRTASTVDGAAGPRQTTSSSRM